MVLLEYTVPTYLFTWNEKFETKICWAFWSLILSTRRTFAARFIACQELLAIKPVFMRMRSLVLQLNLFSWECDLLCYNLWNMICNILGTFRTGLTQIKLSSPVKIQDRKLISDISLGIHQADINFDWNIWRTCWSLLYSF